MSLCMHPIEVGAVWVSKGSGGHGAGPRAQVTRLTALSVTFRPLSGHRRRASGDGAYSVRREVFLLHYLPQSGPDYVTGPRRPRNEARRSHNTRGS